MAAHTRFGARWPSYIIVGIVGAFLFILYWWFLSVALSRLPLADKTPPNNGSSKKEPEPKPEPKPPGITTPPPDTSDRGKPRESPKDFKAPEKPQSPVPAVEDIRSIMFVLRTTWVPKLGASITQGDLDFLYVGSGPLAALEGAQGSFPFEVAQTINIYVQGDNRVVITNRYVLARSSDLLGRPVENLESMQLGCCPLIHPFVKDSLDHLTFIEITVFVNEKKFGFFSASAVPNITCPMVPILKLVRPVS